MPYCHHRAVELRREGKRERLVRVEEAPGRPFDFGRFELVEEAWPEDYFPPSDAVPVAGGAGGAGSGPPRGGP
jgi:hypothetical protein